MFTQYTFYITLFLALFPYSTFASESYTIAIKDHQFIPNELVVPAGQKFELVIHNQDNSPEEFESKLLKREKAVSGQGHITLRLGPLSPGEYPFLGEYHEATAKGKLIVK